MRLYIWSHTFVTILVPPAFPLLQWRPVCWQHDAHLSYNGRNGCDAWIHCWINKCYNRHNLCPGYNWPVARLLSIYVRNLHLAAIGVRWRRIRDDQPRGGWRTRPMLRDCQIGNADKHVFIASQVLQDSTCFFLKIISTEKSKQRFRGFCKIAFTFLTQGDLMKMWHNDTPCVRMNESTLHCMQEDS